MKYPFQNLPGFVFSCFFVVINMTVYCQISSSKGESGDVNLTDTIKPDRMSVTDTSGYGKVEVIMDYKIQKLIAKKIRICDSLKTIQGYRVQIFFGNGPGSKSQAYRIKSNFVNSFTSIDAYVSWADPNWVVRVGNCRIKLDAQKLKKDIEKDYPGAFIVTDGIEIPGLN